MSEIDECPSVSNDEIFCYLGLGMLAAGMLAGLAFTLVPIIHWCLKNVPSAWKNMQWSLKNRTQSQPLLKQVFAQQDAV